MAGPITAPARILVHRLGSLGDTTIVLPLFHLLRRKWPEAEVRVLTNFPVASVAAPLQAVLGNGIFADGYYPYPPGTRDLAALWRLAGEIRAWKPDIAIYANDVRTFPVTLRYGAFLRLCGARRVIGLPFRDDVRTLRFDPATGLYEREASRIARALSALGDFALDDPANWDLALTDAETAEAAARLDGWSGAHRFVAFSAGTKVEMKDWTDPNWQAAFERVSAAHPSLGLVAVGADQDRARSEALRAHWTGPSLNLCGATSPRVSAAVIARAAIFLGNDSGPMHLAASVGTPAVAVFSRHSRPGIWFPMGARHRIFYPGLSWSGGVPPVLRDAAGETTITSIPPGPVAEACLGLLATQ